MKKWMLVLSIMALIALVLTGCAPSATTSAPAATTTAPAKTYTLKMATYRPPADTITLEWEKFVKKVSERSKGQLDIKLFSAGSLLDSKTQFTGVVDRLADMSDVVPTGHAGQVPLTNAIDLVFALTSYTMGSDAIKAGLGPILDTEYAKYGVKPLMWFPSGRLDMFTKFPVKTPNDFKGKLLRGAGGLQLKFMELCGASTVQMAAGEIYQAMQTGTIDGFTLTDGTCVSMRLYEVTKYATLMPVNTAMAEVVMNLKSYSELPANLQKILNDTALETEVEVANAVKANDVKAQNTMREKGMTVYELTPSELAAFKAIGITTWDQFLKDNPGAAAAQAVEIIKKVGK